MGRFHNRIKRTEALLTRFRDEVHKKRAAEGEKVRVAALKVARFNQQVKDQSDEEFMEAFGASDGMIEAEKFIAFFAEAEKAIRPFKADAEDDSGKKVVPDEDEEAENVELDPEDLKEVFALLCGEEPALSTEVLLRELPRYYIVITQTAMTDRLAVKDGQTKRRVDVDEVLRVVKGPVKETTAGVLRLQVRSQKDDAEGWVSISGNAGTVFLKEGGRQFKVVKETTLTAAFELEGEGEGEDATKLKVGEVLDVQEWPKKEAKSGLMRAKVTVKSTGAAGWVTSTAKDGTALLKAL